MNESRRGKYVTWQQLAIMAGIIATLCGGILTVYSADQTNQFDSLKTDMERVKKTADDNRDTINNIALQMVRVETLLEQMNKLMETTARATGVPEREIENARNNIDSTTADSGMGIRP